MTTDNLKATAAADDAPAATEFAAILNPDAECPHVHFIGYDGVACPALVFSDRRAVVFAGHWAANVGFDLIGAALTDVVLLDSQAHEILKLRAQRLVALLDEIKQDGLVRDLRCVQ
jgi:hypothetical protein